MSCTKQLPTHATAYTAPTPTIHTKNTRDAYETQHITPLPPLAPALRAPSTHLGAGLQDDGVCVPNDGGVFQDGQASYGTTCKLYEVRYGCAPCAAAWAGERDLLPMRVRAREWWG